MRLDFCAVCGTTNDLQQHHITPVVVSNAKRNAKKKKYNPNTPLKDCSFTEIFAYLFDIGIISDDEELTVCSYHHNILHGIIKFQVAEHSNMIKRGIEKAKSKGIKIGRPTKLDTDTIQLVTEHFENGLAIKKIAKKANLGIGTVYEIIRKNDLKRNDVGV